MSKDSFKAFARKHPELANTVLKEKASWQKLYELYEIYGEDSTVWNKYINNKETSIKEIIDNFKNIDLESLQNGIKNIQNTISIIQNVGTKEKEPIYKRFE